MKNAPLIVALGTAVTIAASVSGARHAAADKINGCQQWEVMLGQPARVVTDVKTLPELGKPFVEPAPAGWEPFAFGPSGQLVYRRCAR
ncbi:MAG: hypothetical protein ABUS79_01365 [Pseudomonadota bacterium]